jgi:hypothetical protein
MNDLASFGGLIAGNISTLVTLFGAVGWGVWRLAKLHSKVEEHSKDINAAHALIRELRSEILRSKD